MRIGNLIIMAYSGSAKMEREEAVQRADMTTYQNAGSLLSEVYIESKISKGTRHPYPSDPPVPTP